MATLMPERVDNFSGYVVRTLDQIDNGDNVSNAFPTVLS